MSRVFLKEVQKGNHECYELRWWEGTKRMSHTVGWVVPKGKKNPGGKYISKREAEARQREKQVEVDAAMRAAEDAANLTVEPVVVESNCMTLKEFLDGYSDRRQRSQPRNRGYVTVAPKLSKATLTGHLMTLKYLLFHFGDDQAIDSINLDDARQFVDRLVAGELEGARTTSQRYDLKDGGVRGHLRNAKAIYKYMMLFDGVQVNPFALFSSKPLTGRDNYYVSLREFLQFFKAAPSRNWQLFLALQRLGGLRREAARVLPWRGVAVDSQGVEHRIGVDWDRHRLMVMGNCKGGEHPYRYREVPIRPWLYRLLRKMYEASPARFGHPDEEVKPISGISCHNLVRIGKHICIDARLKAWPRLFQSLRSSTENDWKAMGVPEATYTAWMGHSSKVSREHYVRPMDSEFNYIANIA